MTRWSYVQRRGPLVFLHEKEPMRQSQHEVRGTANFRPRSGLQQRKCACGTHTMGGGQCAECQKKQINGSPLQTKLAISEPGDRYEQEADRMADVIMRKPILPSIGDHDTGEEDGEIQRKPLPGVQALQRQMEDNADDEEETVQFKRESGTIVARSSAIESGVNAVRRSGGQPLDAPTRTFFESHLGHDLSGVRVHADGPASESARSVKARAYTVGQDVVFGQGQYSPKSSEGRRLLAHELTHVIQQSHGNKKGDTASIHLQRQEEKQWKYKYKTKKEAHQIKASLEQEGIDTGELIEVKGEWTFSFVALDEKGAKAQQKKLQEEKGDKYSVTIGRSKSTRSYYVKVSPRCPEAIPEKKDFEIWPKCFLSEKEAKKQKSKFDQAHIKAETVKLGDKQFGLYYKPLGEEEAKTIGEKEAGQRLGYKEDMYEVEVGENKGLKSFGYSIKAKCPEGFQSLGSFMITSYTLAQEKEFPASPTVTDPCGLKGTFRKAFLFQTDKSPRGVKMQGSGKSLDGRIIHYKDKDCFEILGCPTTASQTCAVVGRTVAVDKRRISLGSELLIEDLGPRVADDVGGGIKGMHIDDYVGDTMTGAEANKRTLKNKLVCRRKKSKGSKSTGSKKAPPPKPSPSQKGSKKQQTEQNRRKK